MENWKRLFLQSTFVPVYPQGLFRKFIVLPQLPTSLPGSLTFAAMNETILTEATSKYSRQECRSVSVNARRYCCNEEKYHVSALTMARRYSLIRMSNTCYRNTGSLHSEKLLAKLDLAVRLATTTGKDNEQLRRRKFSYRGPYQLSAVLVFLNVNDHVCCCSSSLINSSFALFARTWRS